MSESKNITIWAPQLIACLILLWALNPGNPYGYYIFLRWVCCAIFIYLTFNAFELEKQGWTWTLGVLAFLYNPIIKFHLDREMWTIINLVTIAIAIASIWALKKTEG